LKNSNSTGLDIATVVVQDQVSSKEYASFSIADTSLNVAASLMPTVFIISRIVFIRRRHVKLMGQCQFSSALYPHSVLLGSSDNAKQYMSIITMLIESYVLDAAWTLAELVFPIASLLSPLQSRILIHSGAAANILNACEYFIRVSLPAQQKEFSDDDCTLVYRSLLIFLLYIE
jgi:hypothetical protein